MEESSIEDVVDAGSEANNAPEPVVVRRNDLLSTGSTLLNLALTDRVDGGFLKGHYFYIVGDSNTGKTFFGITCFAEATLNPNFAEYRLIFDNAEKGMLIDTDRMFNEALGDRMESPGGNGQSSEIIEEFYDYLDDANKDPRPYIYFLDSQDAIDSEAAIKKYQAQKKVRRKGKEAEDEEEDAQGRSGSYGDGKAKKHSENLRKAMGPLHRKGSILIITGQTRDVLNSRIPGLKGRSGGRALKFYATAEVWTSLVYEIKKTVNGIPRRIGVKVKLDVKKNRITGKQRQVEVDIYDSVGIDDLGSMVDYLVKEGVWRDKKGKIAAPGLFPDGEEVEATRDKIIKQIEKHGLEEHLRTMVGKCWAEVEAALAVKRKNKYQ